MPSHRSHTGWILALPFLLVGLAACGGGDDRASTDPTPSPSPTATPSPDPGRQWLDLTAPHQCMQAPWGRSDEDIRAYFEAHDVEVHEVRRTSRGMVCAACSCPEGTVVEVLVDAGERAAVEALIPWEGDESPGGPDDGIWVSRVLAGPPQDGSAPASPGEEPAADSRDEWNAWFEQADVEVLETRWEEHDVCMALTCPSWAGRRFVRIPADDRAEAEKLGFTEVPASELEAALRKADPDGE